MQIDYNEDSLHEFVCFEVLQTINPMVLCWAWSVYLTTPLLGMLQILFFLGGGGKYQFVVFWICPE